VASEAIGRGFESLRARQIPVRWNPIKFEEFFETRIPAGLLFRFDPI
jgi:hypothetical protein